MARKVARPTYTWAERMRRKAAVDKHRRIHGEVCPGWGRPTHGTGPANPLTADHVLAVARGGREDGPLQVLCRACNSAKRDRVTVRRRTAVGAGHRRWSPRVAPARAMVAAGSPSRNW